MTPRERAEKALRNAPIVPAAVEVVTLFVEAEIAAAVAEERERILAKIDNYAESYGLVAKHTKKPSDELYQYASNALAQLAAAIRGAK